jgi:hypothetical protein
MRKTLLGMVAAVCFCGQALAQDGLSYSFVELGYIGTESDSGDGDGLNLAGSYAVAELAHIFTSYSDQDFDNNVRTEFMQIGLGGNIPLTENIDIVPRLSYVDLQVETPGAILDDNGFQAGASLRGRFLDRLELSGGFTYTELGDSGNDTAIVGGLRLYFTGRLAVALDALQSDGDTTYILGGRYDFKER